MASVRHKVSKSDNMEQPLKPTILCEYYLWVRWCNIREMNGYYIYNGMKGNKLSFVHQQNCNLVIYFHTLASSFAHPIESSYTFLSANNNFTPQSSIPENREEDDNDFKLNFQVPESPSSSSTRLDPSTFNIAVNTSSNNSTPCSSPPPESPLSKPIHAPRLGHHDSMDEYLHNHWVIKYENDILYYTKDKHEGNNSIDNEYPPSYGWNYNEKNQSSLPKLYLQDGAHDLINFGAPPPGITRIPIIPEPMIKTFKNGEEPNVYTHGSFKNGQSHNGNIALIPISFDLPVHIIDLVFKLDDNEADLGFGIRMDSIASNKKILQIADISTQSMAYKVGLKQADLIIAVNEEDIGDNVEEGLSKLNELKQGNDAMMYMTVCRRVFDDIMIIVKSGGNEEVNGQYYFHHLDEYNSAVFMQDVEEEEEDNGTELKRMIIRKAHYENDTGESLWTISDKTEDYYVGLSVDAMPPNRNWEPVSKTQALTSPTLVFYNKNQRIDRDKDKEESTENSLDKAQIDDVLDRFSHPSECYNAPNIDGTPPIGGSTPIPYIGDVDSDYRTPSWKKKNEEMKKSDDTDWKRRYNTLYSRLRDVNGTFYEYWLYNGKQMTEIERLKEIISQHRNKFIIIRKELFQQKRREEDLLDKINVLQTHSRQVSSISALFDTEYNLDIQELQDLHKMHMEDQDIQFDNDALDETCIEEKNSKLNSKLDQITFETEINELRVQLSAKDVKIGELEIDINSWQETHSQIYDSFTSATALYREQLEQFNCEEKYYKEENKVLREQLSNKESNIESKDSMELEKQRKYTDIEAELEYNSDSSSSVSDTGGGDSDDSIGGGAHVRRSSKPWMQIKQKYMRQRKKEADKSKSKSKSKENKEHRDSITYDGSPPPPIKRVLSDETGTFLESLPSNREECVDKVDKITFLQQSSVISNLTVATDLDISLDDLPLRTERVVSKVETPTDVSEDLKITSIRMITPDADADHNMPYHPVLHTHKAQSHLAGSIMPKLMHTSTEAGMMMTAHPVFGTHQANSINVSLNEFNFRESNISILSDIVNARDSTINIENVRHIQQQIDMAKEWQGKYNELEIENKDIIASKITLLNNTSREINRLKHVINAVLNSTASSHDIKQVIVKMLKKQSDDSCS